MWRIAAPKDQELTEKRQFASSQFPSPQAADLKAIRHRGLDNSIKKAPHHRKGRVAMQLLILGNERCLGPSRILQQPLKSSHHTP